MGRECQIERIPIGAEDKILKVKIKTVNMETNGFILKIEQVINIHH